MGTGSRIPSIALRCSDVEASAEFYSRLVGLEISRLELGHATLRPPGADRTLLELRRATKPGFAPREATGLFHVAFLFPDRAGLAAAVRRCTEDLGHQFTGAADHGVSEAMYLDDPDGIGIELYADREIDRWPEPSGDERVRMYTEPLDLADLMATDRGEDLPKAAEGVEIGHVHLKVGDTDAAVAFWTGEPGLELMTRFGPSAAFLAFDGYHHHIGANSWHSAGSGPEPAEGPGLDGFSLRVDGGGKRKVSTPDGVAVELLPAGDPS